MIIFNSLLRDSYALEIIPEAIIRDSTALPWTTPKMHEEFLLQSVSDSLRKVCGYRVYAQISEVPRCLNVINGPARGKVSPLFMIVQSYFNH